MPEPRPSEGTPLVQFRAGKLRGVIEARAARAGISIGQVAMRDLTTFYALIEPMSAQAEKGTR